MKVAKRIIYRLFDHPRAKFTFEFRISNYNLLQMRKSGEWSASTMDRRNNIPSSVIVWLLIAQQISSTWTDDVGWGDDGKDTGSGEPRVHFNPNSTHPIHDLTEDNLQENGFYVQSILLWTLIGTNCVWMIHYVRFAEQFLLGMHRPMILPRVLSSAHPSTTLNVE